MVKLRVCVSASKLKNMQKKIRRDSLSNGRKSMHQSFPKYMSTLHRYIRAQLN